jgi:hypothetical protein
MAFAIARTAKQKGGGVAASGHHNDRTRETLNADPARAHLNRTLIGDSRNVREIVSEVIAEHGGCPRSDSVEAVEIMLTATHEYFTDEKGEIEMERVEKFVDRALAFLEDPRSGGICVKAELHLDERTPHIQAHKVPIDPEGKLNCKHYFGGREKMAAFQDLYHEYMRPLGLERGERGSRARHTDIQKYYGAVTRDYELKIDLEKFPDPPVLHTEKALKKYKQEILKAFNEQVKEPLKILQHQAMLTREEASKREAAVARAEERVKAAERTTTIAMQQHDAIFKENRELEQRLDRMSQTNVTLRTELTGQHAKVAEQGKTIGELKDRLRDIPLPDVMEKMGYGREQVRGEFIYRGAENQIALSIKDGLVRDANRNVVCRNSVDLVLQMKNEHEGLNITHHDAVDWLADNFGEKRAVAAHLINQEQALSSSLRERLPEREREQMRPEMERTPEIEMPEHDLDLGFSR